MAQDKLKTDAAFGHWLAGFIAGEGCFRIHKSKGGIYYACHFALKLRDDERPILEQIVRRTGIGYLRPDIKRNGRSNPALVWTVHSQEDSLRLLRLMDRYPLRARKQKEHALWRRAVPHWTTMRRGNRWHGPRDWSKMIALKAAIEHARTYR